MVQYAVKLRIGHQVGLKYCLNKQWRQTLVQLIAVDEIFLALASTVVYRALISPTSRALWTLPGSAQFVFFPLALKVYFYRKMKACKAPTILCRGIISCAHYKKLPKKQKRSQRTQVEYRQTEICRAATFP